MKLNSRISINILVQGSYGNRIAENLKNNSPSNWKITVYQFSKDIPKIIENPESLFPKNIVNCDVIISLGENPALASILPDLVRLTGAKAVIAPVDNPVWLPQGVITQISKELKELNVQYLFPMPFCSMDPNTGLSLIDEFAAKFGRPELQIELENNTIKKVRILRGSPCGSAHYMSEGILGLKKNQADKRAGLLIQIFPCLASRSSSIGKKPLIHIAAKIAMAAVLKSLSKEKQE
ncbi:MAG: hypothetical protein FK732_00240 [Asgard group archaeon]|nr:hypothetical protein [Asgard group archaeon]